MVSLKHYYASKDPELLGCIDKQLAQEHRCWHSSLLFCPIHVVVEIWYKFFSDLSIRVHLKSSLWYYDNNLLQNFLVPFKSLYKDHQDVN